MNYLEHWREQHLKRKNLAFTTDCYRIADRHSLTPSHQDIRLDKIGSALSVQWFIESAPDVEFFKQVDAFCKEIEIPHWFVRHMINRGQNPNQKLIWLSPQMPDTWTAKERSLEFLFKVNEGTSPGLFLDQRDRRQWTLEKSREKNVLNLFSYTGGFSVAAAKGGAQKVTTVDVSKRYIEWSRENFKLNQLNDKDHEFWSADVFTFLEGAIKRGRTFDFIICDPPSFGRSAEGIFKFGTDYKKLISMCAQLLNDNGVLNFSCNFEDWTQETFEKKCYDTQGDQFKVVEFPKEPTDFTSRILKTCLFKKT